MTTEAEKLPSSNTPLTYAQLQDALSEQLAGSVTKPATLSSRIRNARTALTAWLRHIGKTLVEEIGDELQRNVDARISGFFDGELARGIGRTTARDRKYFVGRARALYMRLRSAHLPRSFAGAL